jgi:hypothetical protein
MQIQIGTKLQISHVKEVIQVVVTSIGEDYIEGDVLNNRCLKTLCFVRSQVVAILTP